MFTIDNKMNSAKDSESENDNVKYNSRNRKRSVRSRIREQDRMKCGSWWEVSKEIDGSFMGDK